MAHSLTGASSADRWMNCSGYLYLASQEAQHDPNRLDPEYTREGTAGHHVAALCLTTGRDAWEFAGETIEGVTLGEDEGEVSLVAVQAYVDECRRITDRRHTWIEEHIGDLNSGFYGTVDFGALCVDALRIRDLKMGIGVYVDVIENEQLMYYAFGLIKKARALGLVLPDAFPVELGIVQPRFWDYDGCRTWTTNVETIVIWGENTLLPKMAAAKAAATENPEYVPGEHCRFCPRKLQCPALRGMFGAAAQMSKAAVDPKAFTTEEIGREYAMIPVVEMFIKALKGEVEYRANAGTESPFWKMVKKKTDRTWKDGALPALRGALGDLAFTLPELKSPAKMEKISDQAKQLVAEWAFMPDGGLTVAQVEDRRPAQKVVKLADVYADMAGKQF